MSFSTFNTFSSSLSKNGIIPISFLSSIFIPTSTQFSSTNTIISGNTNPKKNGNYFTSSSSDQGGQWNSYNAFNGTTTDFGWISGSSAYSSSSGVQLKNISTTADGSAFLGEFVQIQLPSAIKPVSYDIVGRLGSPKSDLRTWYVVGSNDNSTWKLLDTQTESAQTNYRIIVQSIFPGNDYAGLSFKLSGV
jgi:hypothetical protein